MFIQVKLLNGFRESLWYAIPPDWDSASLRGTIVHVPLRNRVLPAVVIAEQKELPMVTFTIKQAHKREILPEDPHYSLFIEQLSMYYQIDPIYFLKRIRHFLDEKEVTLPIHPPNEVHTSACNQLTDEQQHVCNFLHPHITKPSYTPTVLHGVTGSGKTEIYKQLIAHTIACNKAALFLLPEVTLALAFEKRLRHELNDHIPIYSFHSASSTKDKQLVWQQLLAQQPMVLIGVHLPVLLPIAQLGLIIVDEEHDVGYQATKHPKINAKEAALIRAQIAHIPIILGSATPSLHTLYNVKQRGWHFFQLKKRFAGAFPTIQIVPLLDKKQRKQFWISQPLYNAINDRVHKKEQTIIFLNRRGYSFFVQCTQCSFVFTCSHCSVSLTLHENNTIICHYCGFKQLLAPTCPTCKTDQLLKKGIGTQQIVSILTSLFPHTRIARADLDVTSKKKVWQQTIHDFTTGTIDILVGTQTITKGYHFPNVTLVGILWADLHLNFPMYNAAETALQQLIQVAGRAGRQHNDSLVIVQTMMDHQIFSYLNEIDYVRFYTQEINTRIELGYPPHMRLVELELKNNNEIYIEQEAHTLASYLQNRQLKNVYILGPAQPPIHKIKNTHIRKIYIKCTTIHDALMLYQSINKASYSSSIFFTPNPLQ